MLKLKYLLSRIPSRTLLNTKLAWMLKLKYLLSRTSNYKLVSFFFFNVFYFKKDPHPTWSLNTGPRDQKSHNPARYLLSSLIKQIFPPSIFLVSLLCSCLDGVHQCWEWSLDRKASKMSTGKSQVNSWILTLRISKRFLSIQNEFRRNLRIFLFRY